MIHETAIIDSSAKLAEGVQVGPWSYIGPGVEIGKDTIVASHVVIKGPTTIGEGNRIFQFCSIGEDCQDLKYRGEPTRLEIGDRNIFREYVCVHRGTVQDHGLTKIGNDNLFVTYSHVAHDCIVGNHTIIGHHVGLAGHVRVDDFAILSGYVAVHQFCHIGAHSFLGGGTMLVKDLPPFILAALDGGDAKALTVNSEGLKRRGFTSDDLVAIKRAYKVLYRQGNTLDEAIVKLEALVNDSGHVQSLIDFVKTSSRGILR